MRALLAWRYAVVFSTMPVVLVPPAWIQQQYLLRHRLLTLSPLRLVYVRWHCGATGVSRINRATQSVQQRRACELEREGTATNSRPSSLSVGSGSVAAYSPPPL